MKEQLKNNLFKGLVPLLIVTSTPALSQEDDITQLNRNQLSSYTQECRDYITQNPSYNNQVVQSSLRGIESYLQDSSSIDLNSIQGIGFTQTFEGMRDSSCSMLPTLLYDIEDGIFINYRN
ncbi:MAG: hypothetical protein LAT82_01485 [Nanoarchaeota archaeon]|nr:hypothetical protein [Nanoarchaeota archaeon]